LVTKRSRTLGLFFLSRIELDFMENFGTQFFSGITRAAYTAGYDLLLFTTPRDTENAKSYMRLCKERHVEGAIFIGLTSDDPHLDEIVHSPLPVSIIDYRLDGPNVGFVGTDSSKGIRAAMDWLVACGHDRIAFIGGPEASPVAVLREQTYRDFLRELGPPHAAEVGRGDFSRMSGYRCALEIMDRGHMPTAVLAANDFMALGAIKAFKEHGLRVPADVSVMGYDNAAVSEYADPALTTIGQDTETIGARAVGFIIDRLDQRESERLMNIAPRLIVRESVRLLLPDHFQPGSSGAEDAFGNAGKIRRESETKRFGGSA
jgi:DNA-binding LacI/PurR family transcriptional regulator